MCVWYKEMCNQSQREVQLISNRKRESIIKVDKLGSILEVELSSQRDSDQIIHFSFHHNSSLSFIIYFSFSREVFALLRVYSHLSSHFALLIVVVDLKGKAVFRI
jgi:SUMO ligase MMS21 Smc5/6 complex component